MRVEIFFLFATVKHRIMMTRTHTHTQPQAHLISPGIMTPQDAVRDIALVKVHDIIEDSRVAAKFFYVEMTPKMAAIAAGYNSSYHVDITAAEVATATYISCWEDDWAKLRSFNGGTTVCAWVAKIASQAAYQMLLDEHFIDGKSKTKINDYRLTLRSIDDPSLRKAIVELVSAPKMHRALELYYVDKVSDKELAQAFSNADEAKKCLKDAEKTLIRQLLNTENPFAEMALSLKKPGNQEVQWQEWYDRIDDDDISDNHRALRELLVDICGNEDWDANVSQFVKSFIKDLGWNEREIDLWSERFFNNTPSLELAERYHVRNSWVDNTYSRLFKRFRIALKSWWLQFDM